MGFLKMPVFVPVFWGNTSWGKIVHIVLSQLQQNPPPQKKTSETIVFLRESGFLLLSNNNQILHKKQRNTNWAHWCFLGPWIGFTSKAKRWCFKNHYFLRVLEVFACCFVNHFFLFFCPFVFLNSLVWSSYLHLWLLFRKSTFYVVVVASCCFGFFVFNISYHLNLYCFFGLVFLLFFEGLRVKWGGPKGHLTWP